MHRTPQGTLGQRQCTLQTKYLFYACQHVLSLSALFMLVSTFDACQFFSCLSATEIVRFMLVKVCGKLKIEFTQNDLLFQSGLSGLSFGSRQNTKYLVLDLSVLYGYGPHTIRVLWGNRFFCHVGYLWGKIWQNHEFIPSYTRNHDFTGMLYNLAPPDLFPHYRRNRGLRTN